LDITGQTVFETRGLAPSITIAEDIPSGIYIGCIMYRNGVISQKMYLE
jgi:hypothetical protein